MEIKIFKRKKVFKKGGLHVNPDIYWEALLGIALLIVITSFIFGFLFFGKVNEEFILSGENLESQTKTISKKRIDKALQYFKERKERSDEILNSASPVVDPSR